MGILFPQTGKDKDQKIIISGKKDLLTGGYFLVREDKRTFCKDAETFAGCFFQCRFTIPEVFWLSEDYILEARAEADILKRPPPLLMLDPIYQSEITKTRWVQFGD